MFPAAPDFDPQTAVAIMRKLGMEPDPWQRDVLTGRHPRVLLNCCRQAGKSTTAAILALVEGLFRPGAKVLIVSRSHRQAGELLRRVKFYAQVFVG